MTKKLRLVLLALILGSGFSALTYEILWTRMLSLTFGTTMPAVSIVAAMFMAGLAGGSLFFGRRADRSPSPLRLFAMLELGIALFAIAFPLGLDLITAAYVKLAGSYPEQSALIILLRLGCSALLILPPTFCMGGTFPLICRFFIRSSSGGIPGAIYAMNTVGAAAGAYCSGYFLLPALGVSGTLTLAIWINLTTALVSLTLSRKKTKTGRPAQNSIDAPVTTPYSRRVPIIGIAVVGALAMALEMLWTRLLLLFLGATTYAFATILGVFLVGLALGGGIGALLLRKPQHAAANFTKVTLLMGVSIMATAPFYDRLADLFQAAHEAAAPNWSGLSLLFLAIALSVTLIPTVCSGALLPIAIELLREPVERVGQAIGKTVLANTLGSIAGSLLATFAMIPLLGLENSFRLTALLAVLTGIAFFFHFRCATATGRVLPALLLCSIVLLFLPWNWDQARLNSGVYIYSYYIKSAGGLDLYLDNFKLIESVEGLDATATVMQVAGSGALSLAVNGKFDASSATDMATQQLLGHLPLLLHPDPRQALIIGLGSGITLGATAGHEVDSIRCVEISGEVIQLAKHFKLYNRNALNDRRVELIQQDARNQLLIEPRGYDVIISEPSNPWQSGNANLFTDEFYQLAESRLLPRGLFCQWIPLYDMSAENLRTVLATFQKNFPEVLAFVIPESNDAILVGSTAPIAFDYKQIQRRMQQRQVREDLARIGIHTPGDLAGGYFLTSSDRIRRLTDKASINSDDSPELEFSYPELFTLTQSEHSRFLAQTQPAQDLPLSFAGLTEKDQVDALSDLARGFAASGDPDSSRYFQ